MTWFRRLLTALRSALADEPLADTVTSRAPDPSFHERFDDVYLGMRAAAVIEKLGRPVLSRTMSESLQGAGASVVTKAFLERAAEQVMLQYPDPGDGLEYYVFVQDGVVIDKRLVTLSVAKSDSTESSAHREQASGAADASDPFIRACLDVEYREHEDARWFSHFPELPQIDALRKSGKRDEALTLCREGMERYPDSFLFYGRTADLLDELGRPAEAEHVLKEGLSNSLSKCTIAGALGDRGLAIGDHRDAIRWWITAGVLQLESKIMVDKMPFLSLAYVSQRIGAKEAEAWLLAVADRASNEGPVRFNAEGAALRHELAKAAMKAKDDAAQHAIVAFYERYR